MAETTVKYRRMPRWNLEAMPEADRKPIIDAVEELRATDPSQWPESKVVRLPKPVPTYILRAPRDWRNSSTWSSSRPC